MQTAVKNVETHMAKVNDARWQLPTKADTPLKASYRPELDVSPELDTVNAAYYQSLIGVLRWIVELGHVDVCLEVSMMSSHIALPREGHLKALLQIFAYLKKQHNAKMVYDPSQPEIDNAAFDRKDWTLSEFRHLQGIEELPPKMPEPRGIGLTMVAKADADHTADTITRRSHMGFLVYLNSAFNRILSKVQKSFWSCTHVNSCQKYTLYINLHILLNILSKTTSNIQESRKSIKRLKR